MRVFEVKCLLLCFVRLFSLLNASLILSKKKITTDILLACAINIKCSFSSVSDYRDILNAISLYLKFS